MRASPFTSILDETDSPVIESCKTEVEMVMNYTGPVDEPCGTPRRPRLRSRTTSSSTLSLPEGQHLVAKESQQGVRLGCKQSVWAATTIRSRRRRKRSTSIAHVPGSVLL